MALPMETSAPTYRNIAHAPKTAQRDLSAVTIEGRCPSSTGLVTSSSLRNTKMNMREQHQRAGDHEEHAVDLAERFLAQRGRDLARRGSPRKCRPRG